MLGAPVRYRVHEGHKTETVKGTKTVTKPHPETGAPMQAEEPHVVKGSIHHPEMSEFAGMVTAMLEDGMHNLIIFPPNKPPVHVDGVKEGAGHHEFTFLGKSYGEEPAPKAKGKAAE